MANLYKVFFIIIIFFLAFLSVAFFLFNDNFRSIFRVDPDIRSVEEIKMEVEEGDFDYFFDLNRINDPKFNSLVDFSMDMSNFKVPDDLLEDDLDFYEDLNFPEFKIGNENPFSPFW